MCHQFVFKRPFTVSRSILQTLHASFGSGMLPGHCNIDSGEHRNHSATNGHFAPFRKRGSSASHFHLYLQRGHIAKYQHWEIKAYHGIDWGRIVQIIRFKSGGENKPSNDRPASKETYESAGAVYKTCEMGVCPLTVALIWTFPHLRVRSDKPCLQIN